MKLHRLNYVLIDIQNSITKNAIAKEVVVEVVEVSKDIKTTEAVTTEVVTIDKPKTIHKAKKGQKLTEEQKAENKAIKRAEFLASPKGEIWLIDKWITDLDRELSQCQTTVEKDKVIETFKSRGLKQEQFINSMISKYEPSSSTFIPTTFLANWATDNRDLAIVWGKENPVRANEIELRLQIVMPLDDFEYKGPYFKT